MQNEPGAFKSAARYCLGHFVNLCGPRFRFQGFRVMVQSLGSGLFVNISVGRITNTIFSWGGPHYKSSSTQMSEPLSVLRFRVLSQKQSLCIYIYNKYIVYMHTYIYTNTHIFHLLLYPKSGVSSGFPRALRSGIEGLGSEDGGCWIQGLGFLVIQGYIQRFGVQG